MSRSKRTNFFGALLAERARSNPDLARRNPHLAAQAAPAPAKPAAGGMNWNEERYYKTILQPMLGTVIETAEYEPETFELATGKYTPDWGGLLTAGGRYVVECKLMVEKTAGGYRINHDRNRKDFKVASLVMPETLCVWARWHPGCGRYLQEAWKGGVRVKGWKWEKENPGVRSQESE